MILLDTNVVSAMMRLASEPLVEAWLNNQDTSSLWTSTVTVYEIRYGIHIMPGGKRKSELERDFAEVVNEALERRVLPLEMDAAIKAGAFRAKRKLAGAEINIPDAMIAGIAVSHGYSIATRNTKDFQGLGLALIDPWA